MTRTVRARRTERVDQPLYARALRLRHLAPSGLLCFVFLEGAVVLGILLALAELVSWWGVIVLPVTVALMVKFNDLVAGAFTPRPAGTETASARTAVLRPATMQRSGQGAPVSRYTAPVPVTAGVPEAAPAGRPAVYGRGATFLAAETHADFTGQEGASPPAAGFRVAAARDAGAAMSSASTSFSAGSADDFATGFASTPGHPGYASAAEHPGYAPETEHSGYVAAQSDHVPVAEHPGYPSVAEHPGYPPVAEHPGYPPVAEPSHYGPVTEHPDYAPVTGQPDYPPVREHPGFASSGHDPGDLAGVPAVGYPGSYTRGVAGNSCTQVTTDPYGSGQTAEMPSGDFQVRTGEEARTNSASTRRPWADQSDVRQQMARQAASRRYE